MRLARSLLFRRRYAEALAACERGLQVTPTHLGMLESRAMVHAARGDVAAREAAMQRASRGLGPGRVRRVRRQLLRPLLAARRRNGTLLYRLTPGQFDDDRGAWGLSLAGAYALQGDRRHAQAYADSAASAFESQVRETPENGQLHALLGVALAYLGRKDEAIREGRRGVELVPITKNAFQAPYIQHQLARIYLLVGEPEQALDELEPLLKVPTYLSPGWLRIDPAFDPLRNNPRFQQLAKGQRRDRLSPRRVPVTAPSENPRRRRRDRLINTARSTAAPRTPPEAGSRRPRGRSPTG